MLDGALILVGGSLFIVPGFITDVLGLLPPAPADAPLARVGLVRNLQSRLVRQATRFGGPPCDPPGGERAGVTTSTRPPPTIESARLPR